MLKAFFATSHPHRTSLVGTFSAIWIALLSPPLAHSEEFLVCNQRPHRLESIAPKTKLPKLVSFSEAASNWMLPAGRSAGCAYAPSLTWTSLTTSNSSTWESADRIQTLTHLIIERNTPLEPLRHAPRLTVTITNSPDLNAFIRNGSELRITRGMLERLAGPADVAFLVAHELAHLQLRHQHDASLTDEIEADALAATLVVQAGISPCGAPALLSRVLADSARPETIQVERTQALVSTISGTCGLRQSVC
jgi:hypothetical protein